jgi:hypothetical protein
MSDDIGLNSDIKNGPQEAVFSSFFNVKTTLLHHDDHGRYRISPYVFTLSAHAAKCPIN